ncbi:DUF3566 domain-containing protein [Canibacter zhoujuaniae]|uniref:DUF3566 domain-containing protein n=1 Tax=Canibacter zhoujuaniae TaxID=2708343 RepID=UPI0014209D9D|nr:DUF3566 domain-containing protein [Canibacter zhoujuaniae]
MNEEVAEQLATKARRRAPAKQVRLKLAYVDFWSAVKYSFVISLCLAVAAVVATALIYLVLLQTGVFDRISGLLSDAAGTQFDIANILGLPQVMGFALICGLLNTVVGTALGGLAAVIYNSLVRALGGFQLGFTSN